MYVGVNGTVPLSYMVRISVLKYKRESYVEHRILMVNLDMSGFCYVAISDDISTKADFQVDGC